MVETATGTATIDQLIINSPYEEPREHWKYHRETRTFTRETERRKAEGTIDFVERHSKERTTGREGQVSRMSLLTKETEANFNAFDADWRKHMAEVSAELAKQESKFLQSYRRIVSLQAWRAFLESRISAASLSFFLEAQNDALTSHVFASLGSWRSALKALRSCIENVIFCIYYKDHPVEFTLWETGQHRPPIAEFMAYLDRHPQRIKEPAVDPMPHVQAEYSTLSKAVHASAKNFRMTKDIKTTLLWSAVPADLGQWQTREIAVLLNLNLLLLAHFRGELTGATAAPLREAVSLAIPATSYPEVKAHLGVVLREA